ncbi:MAG: alpha/beta hydrolase [Pseudomonadota bacterium]
MFKQIQINMMHVVLLCSFLLFSTYASNINADTEFRPPGKFIYLDNQIMYIDCLGDSSPTVLIDVGLGDSSANWYKLARKLSKEVRVCVYDRAGYGWSNTGPGERTTEQITYELSRLLMKAEIPAPYVLVGHSFGGFTARYFATVFPEQTAGIVLVDSSHPEQIERLAELDNIQMNEPLKITRREPAPDWMNQFEKKWYQLNSSRKAIVAQMSELKDFAKSAEQVSNLGQMPNIPLAVISRGKTQLPEIDGIALEGEWQSMQKDLLSLSKNSWQEIIENSGHQIYFDAPDAIIRNIMKVVELARNSKSKFFSYYHYYDEQVNSRYYF